MTITTKYDIGQLVWTVWPVPFKRDGRPIREVDYKAFETKIEGVNVYGDGSNVYYLIEPPIGTIARTRQGRMLINQPENHCWKTKEEAQKTIR